LKNCSNFSVVIKKPGSLCITYSMKTDSENNTIVKKCHNRNHKIIICFLPLALMWNKCI
jgi:hypothetical protein